MGKRVEALELRLRGSEGPQEADGHEMVHHEQPEHAVVGVGQPLRDVEDADVLLEWYREYVRVRSSKFCIYNRVQKTGSETAEQFMLRNGDSHELDLTTVKLGPKFFAHTAAGSLNWKRWYRATVHAHGSESSGTVVGSAHGSFVDLHHTDLPLPIMINSLREPKARLRSKYYYDMNYHGDFRWRSYGATTKDGMPMLLECVTLPRCREGLYHVSDNATFAFLPVADGSTDFAHWPRLWPTAPDHSPSLSENTLPTATAVMLNEYLMVLLLEELDNSWRLLECLMPGDGFRGAAALWDEQKARTNAGDYHGHDEEELTRREVEAMEEFVEATGEQVMYDTAVYRWCGLWRMAVKHLACGTLEGVEEPRLCAGL